ncbi:hypothetical protein BUE93_09435 [Chromobacterium amazonense]|uniref:HNH nuclease domain-containing protein n=2 Tax=Chromobacterium amazonense TaxID=1382803 RepID=A0A2S9X599_9NEIS|nr:hypothetical protein BUE93_09435 [Chromobacterium amazonense]
MREGDVVLTVYDNCYHFVSTVLAKLHSPKLAREIWQEDDDGNTWEYMYLLTRPESVNLHVSAEPVSSLLNKSYRGFAKISDEKVQHIFHTYGGLQQFIAREFNKIIPDSAGKNVLKSIEIRVEDEPFTPSNDVDAREKVLREIVRRRGQPQFRRQLLKAYQGRCAVTGCDVESVLEAAHIMPYLGDHTNHITNGLLLRADIHTLFDLGELRVDSAGRIHVADELLSGFYGDLHGRYISLPIDEKKRPNPNALQLKFQQGI